ncbi:MAG: FG-GAP repeat domain-containing protein [Pirellulaceae bacterium]
MYAAPRIKHRHLLMSLGFLCIAAEAQAVPPRTTEIRFRNQTEQTLTLVKQSTPNGSWTPKLTPPTEIKPGAQVMFKSECNGPTGDINANVRYRLGNTGKSVLEIYISWSNPFIESSYKNVYHEQGPFGYELFHTGGQGGHAKASFVLAKSRLHAVPGFKPSMHGFRFSNGDWKKDNIKLPVVMIPFPKPVGDINITNTTHGMCGGMVYAVMDYFYAKQKPPNTTMPPSNESDPLFQYLKRRLMKSWDVTGTGHNYLDYMRPTYPDTDEGVPGSGKGRAWIIAKQEWPKIKADIDAGQLSPLALVQVKSLLPTDIGGNHQVLAYAYDLSGSRVTLHIHDPNEPLDDTVRFVFDIADTSKRIDITRLVQGQSARIPINTIFRTNYDRRVPIEWTEPEPILWHHSSTGEIQFWFMDKHTQIDRRSAVDKAGKTLKVGPPFSIVGRGPFKGKNDLLWHNSSTGEMQIWFMDLHKQLDRRTVVDPAGKTLYIGPPFSIVGTSDFNADKKADILWHNSSTGEIQIWFMDEHKQVRRATVVDNAGKSLKIGPPFSIVGTADFNADRKADILWHNSSTGEIQIWFMNEHKQVRRATVTDNAGKTQYIGPPFSIVGARDYDADGKADVLWHNSSTGEIQIWFMNEHKPVRRAVVADKAGKDLKVGPPFKIVGR